MTLNVLLFIVSLDCELAWYQSITGSLFLLRDKKLAS